MKIKIFIILLSLHFVTSISFSQSTNSNKVETIVDKEPTLINGDDILLTLIKNISLLHSVTESNYTGKVLVEFIALSNGTIGDIKIKKHLCDDTICDSVIINSIKKLPKLSPAIKNSKFVNYLYSLPMYIDVE